MRKLLAPVLALVLAAPLQAQGLRARLEDLFTFGSCGQPLCLDVGGAHGNHFIEAVTEGSGTVIGFVTGAIAKSAANTPISSTSSGATFSIVNGLPVRTSTSAGPIFGERSQTLGRGRFFLGANVSAINYTTLNGAPTDNLAFTFAHEDVGLVGRGDPAFENDVIRMNLGLDVNLVVASIFATWGMTDFLDVGIAIPFVRVGVRGSSIAQIDPFSATPPHHFGGTDSVPILRASRSLDGAASGLGDVVGRVKINLGQTPRAGVALLGEVRFPTGDDDNLLGAGNASVRGMGVFSAQFGNFSPHFNAGYLMRSGEAETDAVLVTAGFDNLMTPWATMAFSLISEWRVGEEKVTLPGPITFLYPFAREMQATSIPQRSSHRLDASLGLKVQLRGGTVLMTNAIVPLRKASLQPDFVWTGGLEFSF